MATCVHQFDPVQAPEAWADRFDDISRGDLLWQSRQGVTIDGVCKRLIGRAVHGDSGIELRTCNCEGRVFTVRPTKDIQHNHDVIMELDICSEYPFFEFTPDECDGIRVRFPAYTRIDYPQWVQATATINQVQMDIFGTPGVVFDHRSFPQSQRCTVDLYDEQSGFFAAHEDFTGLRVFEAFHQFGYFGPHIRQQPTASCDLEEWRLEGLVVGRRWGRIGLDPPECRLNQDINLRVAFILDMLKGQPDENGLVDLMPQFCSGVPLLPMGIDVSDFIPMGWPIIRSPGPALWRARFVDELPTFFGGAIYDSLYMSDDPDGLGFCSCGPMQVFQAPFTGRRVDII